MVFLRDPAAIALISDAGECIDQGSRFIRIQMPTASQTMVNNMTRTPTTTATRWRAVLVGGRNGTPPRAIPMATRSRLNRGVWKGNTLPNMMPLHSSRNAATPVTTRCHKAAFSRAGRIFFCNKSKYNAQSLLIAHGTSCTSYRSHTGTFDSDLSCRVAGVWPAFLHN